MELLYQKKNRWTLVWAEFKADVWARLNADVCAVIDTNVWVVFGADIWAVFEADVWAVLGANVWAEFKADVWARLNADVWAVTCVIGHVTIVIVSRIYVQNNSDCQITYFFSLYSRHNELSQRICVFPIARASF